MILVNFSPSVLSKGAFFAIIITAVQPRIEIESKILILCPNILIFKLVLQVAFRHLDKHWKHLNELWIVRILLLDGVRDFVVVEQELEQVRERVAVSIILRESDLNELWNVVVSQFVGEGLRWHQNLDIVHLFTQFCPDCVPKVNHFLHELASSVPIGRRRTHTARSLWTAAAAAFA